MLLIEDRIPLTDSQRQYTDEGFLIVPARISRTGTQVYKAAEMGLTDREPDADVVVYRPDEEVFSDMSLASFANKPITDDHPPELVNASNSRKYSVGHAGPEVTREGDYAKTVLYVIDEQAIKKIEAGKVELSNGYLADIDWTPGVSPNGENYDAIQRNIKGNHIAIVERGRAGPACRVADNLPNHEDVVMSKVTIDGVDYEVSDQAAQAVSKLQARLKDTEENLNKKDEEMEELEKDMEEEKKDMEKAKDSLQAKLDAAASKVPDAKTLDKMVADRAEFVSKVQKIMPDYDWQGKDSATIKKEVVAAKCPNVQMDSVSADYIDARFDTLADTAPTDSVDNAFRQQANDKSTKTEDSLPADVAARQKFMEDSRNAWKSQGAK